MTSAKTYDIRENEYKHYRKILFRGNTMAERYSVQVLRDCIELQNKKGQDYQADLSTVKQADYYRLGLNTIYDIMHAKMLRMRSLLEKAEASDSVEVNFESIADSAKDLINYASFFAAYAEGKMDGQNPDHDIFNKPKPVLADRVGFDGFKDSTNWIPFAEILENTGAYKEWSHIIKSDEIEDAKSNNIPTIIADDERYPADQDVDWKAALRYEG